MKISASECRNQYYLEGIKIHKIEAKSIWGIMLKHAWVGFKEFCSKI